MKRNSTLIILVISIVLFLAFYFYKYSFPRKFVVQGYEIVEHKDVKTKIYTFNVLFQTFSPLTPDSVKAFRPTWSQHSKSLAYIYQKGDEVGIGIIDKHNQSKYFRLSSPISLIGYDLAWSPDDNSILFLSTSQNGGEFHLLDVTSGLITSLIDIDIPEDNSNYPNFTWSSLETIAIEIDEKIFIVDEHSRSLQFLTAGSNPVWEPNGKWLTYYCIPPSQKGIAICEITPDGKEKRILTEDDRLFFLHREMVWTSDMQYIAFIGGGGGEGDHNYITLFNVQKKEFRNIYRTNGGDRKIYITSIASPLK